MTKKTQPKAKLSPAAILSASASASVSASDSASANLPAPANVSDTSGKHGAKHNSTSQNDSGYRAYYENFAKPWNKDLPIRPQCRFTWFAGAMLAYNRKYADMPDDARTAWVKYKQSFPIAAQTMETIAAELGFEVGDNPVNTSRWKYKLGIIVERMPSKVDTTAKKTTEKTAGKITNKKHAREGDDEDAEEAPVKKKRATMMPKKRQRGKQTVSAQEQTTGHDEEEEPEGFNQFEPMVEEQTEQEMKEREARGFMVMD